jgi:predicted HAD superfamily Cof-like phosphohydrolase
MSIEVIRESEIELVDAVHGFMQIGGQTTGKMNARQACLYTGLQLEEMGEKIEAIIGGSLTPSARAHLDKLVVCLKQYANEFKIGLHEGAILRASHADLIDADFDLAWVSIGALMSTAAEPERAIAHGTYTNLAKFPDGQCIRDEATGKIQKPTGWTPPNFDDYTDKTVLV